MAIAASGGDGNISLAVRTYKRTRNMLEPDQWDSVLGSVTGTVYRGTERISSNATFKLAFQILKEAFKRQLVGGEIVLSTEVTELPREVRRRAVRELVQLGLIKIEQSGNRAIRVTSIINKEEETRPLALEKA